MLLVSSYHISGHDRYVRYVVMSTTQENDYDLDGVVRFPYARTGLVVKTYRSCLEVCIVA
jgi:hypothetical protein